jgi:hypothetical protein
MSDDFEQASTHIKKVCQQVRFKTAWIIGKPLTGKTRLALWLCENHDWVYKDYTLDKGLFDRLEPCIETYQPDNLIDDIKNLCKSFKHRVLVLDHIEPILSKWDTLQQHKFIHKVGRLPGTSGLVLVNNLFDSSVYESILPASNLQMYYVLGE